MREDTGEGTDGYQHMHRLTLHGYRIALLIGGEQPLPLTTDTFKQCSVRTGVCHLIRDRLAQRL